MENLNTKLVIPINHWRENGTNQCMSHLSGGIVPL